jgi:hypothetical protein
MDAQKVEFNRLIKIAGWSQTEAAKRLGKTPGAINHLINPGHPNKPTQTTMRLLKMLVARERKGVLKAAKVTSKGNAESATAGDAQFSVKERDLIQRLRKLSGKDQEKVYAIIRAVLLLVWGRKTRKKK